MHKPMALGEDAAIFSLLTQNILDHALYMVGLDGRIMNWTATAQHIKGYQADEIIGQSIEIFYSAEDQARGEVERALTIARTHGRFEDEGWRVRKNGERFWAHVVLDSVRDNGVLIGFFKTTRDISLQRQTSQALALSEERYRELAGSTTDLVLQIRANGVIDYASPGAKILGYEPEELVGRHRLDLVHPDDRHIASTVVKNLLAGVNVEQTPRREYRFLCKGGGTLWLEGNPRLIRDENGNFDSVISTFRNVSRRRELEDELADTAVRLKALSDRYERLANNANDLVIEATLAGEFTFVSASLTRLTGYDVEEVIGRSALDFVHPKDRARIESEMTTALASTEPKMLEYRHIRKDGQILWMEAQPRIARDPASGRAVLITDVIRDITSRKMATLALADSERKFSDLTNQSHDIIIRYSAVGEITYASPAVLSAIGLAPDQVVGRHVRELVYPEDLEPMWDRVQNFVAATSGDYRMVNEFRLINDQGLPVWVEGNATKLFDPVEGHFTGVQSAIRVISDRKILESAIAAERDAADQAKSDFVANISHEIRTPLTAIIGFSTLLTAKSDLTSDARTYVQKIDTASRMLVAVVNDILDYSKIEQGEMRLNAEPVCVQSLASETLDLFSAQADQKALQLNLTVDENVPLSVVLDPTRLRQILMNLIGNAVKFTDAGHVHVGLTYDQLDASLHIAVTDTGAGLSQTQCEALFERYSQADTSATRRQGGTGLGLAICQGLAIAMGGAISVTSEVGVGSRFAVSLAAPNAPEPSSGTSVGNDLPQISGLRVLIVDDNPHPREISRVILETFGLEVSEATDGPNCLDILARDTVDVVLLDYRMHGMDGVEVLSRIRSTSGPNQNVPVLAFSAELTEQNIDLFSAFDGIVSKPISAEALIKAVSKAVQ